MVDVDVQVQDELLETIDSDRRLSNDWQGLTNSEKQKIINSYQPGEPFNDKIVISQTTGDFQLSYNRVIQPEPELDAEPEGEWFTQAEPVIEPGIEIDEGTYETLFSQQGISNTDINKLIKDYTKLTEEERRAKLKRVSHNSIIRLSEAVPNLTGKNVKFMESFIEDWKQVHTEGAAVGEGPLANMLSQSPESLKEYEGMKTLGEQTDISDLKSLIREWKDAILLDEGLLDDYSEVPLLPVLIRIAKEIGKPTIPQKLLIQHDIALTKLEKHLNHINDTIDDWSSEDINDDDIERLIIKLATNEGRGFMQWAVLQDLTHLEKEVWFSPVKTVTTQVVENIGPRYNPEYQRSERQRGGTSRTITTGGNPLSQLTPGEKALPNKWMIQIQVHRGRSAQNPIYEIPMYLCVIPEIANQHFTRIKLNKGDWVVDCTKGVFIIYEYNNKIFTIIDDDSGASFKIKDISKTEPLKKKLERFQRRVGKGSLASGQAIQERMARSSTGSKWSDLVGTLKDIIKLSEGWEDAPETESMGKNIAEMLNKDITRYNAHRQKGDVYGRRLFFDWVALHSRSADEELRSKKSFYVDFINRKLIPFKEQFMKGEFNEQLDIPEEIRFTSIVLEEWILNYLIEIKLGFERAPNRPNLLTTTMFKEEDKVGSLLNSTFNIAVQPNREDSGQGRLLNLIDEQLDTFIDWPGGAQRHVEEDEDNPEGLGHLFD